MRAPFVYFIREEREGGPVKIGTSYAPVERLAQLYAWSPYPLRIAAMVRGGATLEGRFHTLFHHLHSHHEWFRPDPAIDAVIASISAGSFDVDALPIGPSALRGFNARRSHAARRAQAERVA